MNKSSLTIQIVVIVFVFLLTCCPTVRATDSIAGSRSRTPRVAVVLGGGGAKGVAHIGVLKVLEKAGMPIDLITGASMGSIVGGAYACGHKAQVLDSVVRSQDWSYVLTDRDDMSHQSLQDREKQNTYLLSKALSFGSKTTGASGGIIMGKNLTTLFDMLTAPYNDSISFDQLPIPFACVATDIVDNSEYVFRSGVLSRAMRASMAIPGVFAPVRLDSMVLIDGGLRNNLPVDVARQMGADIVIGVDVQDVPKEADKLKSTTQIISQITTFLFMNKYEENMGKADIVIRVNTDGYSAASFSTSAVDTLIRRGEVAAMAHWDEIVALRKKLGSLEGRRDVMLSRPIAAISKTATHKIGKVVFVNMTRADEAFLRHRFDLEVGDSISAEQAEIMATSIRHDRYYKTASYLIQENPGKNDATLTLMAGEKRDAELSLGVRFDSEEAVALQANATLPIRTRMPMDLGLTLRLGKRTRASIDWTLHPTSFFNPTITYSYRDNDINFYEYGDHAYTFTYGQHNVRLSLFNFNVKNFNISIGANWDYYFYHSLLANSKTQHEVDNSDARDKGYLSYVGRVWYNSEDKWYLPTSGVRFQAKFAYYTDNFVRLDGHVGIREYSGMLRMSFPMGKHFSVQPMVYGRAVYGTDIPIVLDNLMGGEWFDHYVDGQMPFAGVGNLEMAWEKMVAAQLQLQFNPTANNNILLRVAAAQDAPTFNEIMEHSTMLGTTLSYYYNTMFGPLGGSIGYSNLTNKFYYYINLGFVF